MLEPEVPSTVKSDSPLRATLLVAALFAGGLLSGAATGAAAVARAQDPYADLDLFARVLTTIESDYVEEIGTGRLVDAAIRGMVEELDRQSQWLSAEDYQALQDETEGAISGIGVEVRATGGALEVLRVLPGSPALRHGIQPGDRIVEVDGLPVVELTPQALRERLAGPRGEEAVLTIEREGWEDPREVRTVADRIHRPSVEGELLDGVAYLRLVQFQEGAAAELELELGRLIRKAGAQPEGMVLDLRDNPGGLLREAVAVADLFLDEGTIVSTRRRSPDPSLPEEVHPATEGGLPSELAVVVLVNGGSASASEIVAAALQETGRAVLVGEHTYGKGTVQQVYRNIVPDTSALKLTVGRYYTPSGAPVTTGEGRAPDHLVPYPTLPGPVSELRTALADVSLEPAARERIEELLSAMPEDEPRATAIRWDAPMAERLAEDPQLRKAVELLQ